MIVGVFDGVGVREAVAVATLIESLTEQPLVKSSETLNEPRRPPAGRLLKSVAQVRAEFPGCERLPELLVGGV